MCSGAAFPRNSILRGTRDQLGSTVITDKVPAPVNVYDLAELHHTAGGSSEKILGGNSRSLRYSAGRTAPRAEFHDKRAWAKARARGGTIILGEGGCQAGLFMSRETYEKAQINPTVW